MGYPLIALGLLILLASLAFGGALLVAVGIWIERYVTSLRRELVVTQKELAAANVTNADLRQSLNEATWELVRRDAKRAKKNG